MRKYWDCINNKNFTYENKYDAAKAALRRKSRDLNAYFMWVLVKDTIFLCTDSNN